MNDIVYCPMRTADGAGPGSPFHAPEEGDQFRQLNGGSATCTYCGSISESDLFKAIEEQREITPTDKNYKVYVGPSGKFYFQHLSHEGQLHFINLVNEKKVKFGEPGYLYVLPYFMKLKSPE